MTMKPVLHSFAYSLAYLRDQVADVPAGSMAAQPRGTVNHPAWLIGHLTLVCQLLGGAVGVAPWLPRDLAERFGQGSKPVGDAGSYEPKDVALARLGDAAARLTGVIEQLDNARLDAPFPVESYREVFPTLRHALTQVLVGHTAYHIGQLSVWRSAMGLPRMSRGFE